MKCCNRERSTKFCPECGRELAYGVGGEILIHLEQLARTQRNGIDRYKQDVTPGKGLNEYQEKRIANLTRLLKTWETRIEWVRKMMKIESESAQRPEQQMKLG